MGRDWALVGAALLLLSGCTGVVAESNTCDPSVDDCDQGPDPGDVDAATPGDPGDPSPGDGSVPGDPATTPPSGDTGLGAGRCQVDNGGCGPLHRINCVDTGGTFPECYDVDECSVNNGGCGPARQFECRNRRAEEPWCVAVDPCLQDNGGCGDPQFVRCTGEVGAEPRCEDIDNCAVDNGGCGDSTEFTCRDQIAAAPECAPNPCRGSDQCGPAWLASCDLDANGEIICVDRDACLQNNGGCGDPQVARCVDNHLTTPTCIDINECEHNNGGCGDPVWTACINEERAPPTCARRWPCLDDNGGCGPADQYLCQPDGEAGFSCIDIAACRNPSLASDYTTGLDKGRSSAWLGGDNTPPRAVAQGQSFLVDQPTAVHSIAVELNRVSSDRGPAPTISLSLEMNLRDTSGEIYSSATATLEAGFPGGWVVFDNWTPAYPMVAAGALHYFTVHDPDGFGQEYHTGIAMRHHDEPDYEPGLRYVASTTDPNASFTEWGMYGSNEYDALFELKGRACPAQ